MKDRPSSREGSLHTPDLLLTGAARHCIIYTEQTPPHPDHRMTVTYDSSYSIQLLLPSFISPVHIYQSGDLTLISLSSITDFTIALLNLIIFTLWVYITRYYICLIITVSRHIIRQQVKIPNIVLVVATNGRWTCF